MQFFVKDYRWNNYMSLEKGEKIAIKEANYDNQEVRPNDNEYCIILFWLSDLFWYLVDRWKIKIYR